MSIDAAIGALTPVLGDRLSLSKPDLAAHGPSAPYFDAIAWATKPEDRTQHWQARHHAFWGDPSLASGCHRDRGGACVPISALALGGIVTGEHGVGMGNLSYTAQEHGDGWNTMPPGKRVRSNR